MLVSTEMWALDVVQNREKIKQDFITKCQSIVPGKGQSRWCVRKRLSLPELLERKYVHLGPLRAASAW
jgi:hypothetical protein